MTEYVLKVTMGNNVNRLEKRSLLWSVAHIIYVFINNIPV